MKEDMVQVKPSTSHKDFGEVVARALTEASRDCCPGTLAASLARGKTEPSMAGRSSQWFRMNFGGVLQGTAYVAIDDEDMAVFGVGEAMVTQETAPDALLNLFQSTGARIQQSIIGSYGASKIDVEHIAQPALQDVTTVAVEVGSEEHGTQATLYLYLEQRLLAALDRAAESTTQIAHPAENLELVLDVELNATLRFGQRQLSLREILDLNSGSVVELDRQVDEPVELVLDGRVIARGEAVIIDGNYGMRITEILHPINGIVSGR